MEIQHSRNKDKQSISDSDPQGIQPHENPADLSVSVSAAVLPATGITTRNPTIPVCVVDLVAPIEEALSLPVPTEAPGKVRVFCGAPSTVEGIGQLGFIL